VNKEEVVKAKKTEIKNVIVRLQSGEIRKVSGQACCTIGVASNPQSHFTSLGKAGRSRWLGKRPEVRGVAMNAGQYGQAHPCTRRDTNSLQPIIPTVVVEASQRETSLPSVLGVPWPKEATRQDTSGTSTHSWCKTGRATKESEGPNREHITADRSYCRCPPVSCSHSSNTASSTMCSHMQPMSLHWCCSTWPRHVFLLHVSHD